MFICIQICIQQSIKKWHVREQPIVYGRIWKEEWENDVIISSKIKVIIFIKQRILLGCCVVPGNNKSTGYHVVGKIKSFFAFKCSNVNFCILNLYKIYVYVYETALGQMPICIFVFILSRKYPYIKIGFIFKGLNDILQVLCIKTDLIQKSKWHLGNNSNTKCQ